MVYYREGERDSVMKKVFPCRRHNGKLCFTNSKQVLSCSSSSLAIQIAME